MTDPRPMAPEDCLRSLRDGQTLPTLAGRALAVPLLEVVEDLADAEQAHGHHDEVDAVGELQAVERETGSAAEAVAADGGQQQADAPAISALSLLPLPMVATSSTPSSASAAYSGGPKSSATLGDHRRQQRQADDRDRRADEGSDGGDAKRGARLALFGQGEAVEHGDHRGRLTGQSQQHRGDGAAVLGAVVDAGEHDDRRHRVDGVGDRQQDRDGGRGPEAGQHADDHADEHADQAVQQVLRLDDEGEPVEKCVEVHGFSRFRRRSSGATEFAARRGTGSRRPRRSPR